MQSRYLMRRSGY